MYKVVLAILILASVPAHAAILVGAPGDTANGNCFPFGCVGTGGSIYQQVYNQANFGGTVTITGLTFFRTQYSPGGDLNTGTYTISLSTTSKPVNGLDTSVFANNVGLDKSLFFTGSLPASVAYGSSFTLAGGSFTYNPLLGNLLVDVRIDGIGQTNIGSMLDARNGTAGTLFSRASNFGGNTTSYGLVTQFETGTAAVPEPATWSLLSVSLLGLGLLRRRSRT